MMIIYSPMKVRKKVLLKVILFTNYKFSKVENCGTKNFPQKERKLPVGGRALLARAGISRPFTVPTVKRNMIIIRPDSCSQG